MSATRRSKIIAVVLSVSIMLVFIGIIIATYNPFRTLPTINVESSYWILRKTGYSLHLIISTTAPVQLVAVEVGGTLYDMVYDISPPKTEIEIPTPTASSSVTLHFNVGSPKKVYAELPNTPTYVFPVYGTNHIFLAGTLAQAGVVIGVPISSVTRVLLVVPPNEAGVYSYYISLHYPEFGGTIKRADELTPDELNNYTTIIFADIVPEPGLLSELVKKKAVVVHIYERGFGELRFNFTKDGKAVVRSYSPDGADIDYLGAHCIYKKIDYPKPKTDILNIFASLRELTESHYIISPSTYCSSMATEVYATTSTGEVVFAKLRQGFYLASIDLKPVLVLAEAGFFEASGKKIYIENVNPFRGVKPLSMPASEQHYLISIITPQHRYIYHIFKQSISYTINNDYVVLEIGITGGRPVLTGLHSIRIEEYTYDFDLLKTSTNTSITLPATIRVKYESLHTYIVYIDNSPAIIVADENVLDSRPSIVIDHSSICELFGLRVRRLDNIPSPLILYVNGRDVMLLTQSQKTYEDYKCNIGYYDVVVRDVYGNVVQRLRFNVMHIYQSPMFILGVLSAGASVSTIMYALKKREKKEVEDVFMVFYRLPDIEERVFTRYSVINAITNIFSRQKVSPTVSEVINALYRRHPVLNSIVEISKAMDELFHSKEGKQYGVYSRYVPELGDTVTIIGPKTRLVKDFYTTVINGVVTKLGGVVMHSDDVKDIVDVDLVTVFRKKMLILTYAPTVNDIRSAIDRALTALTRIRMIKIPLNFVGVAVVTESQHVKTINDIIDKILDQDESVASRTLRDMTVFTQLRAVSKDMWLSKFIITAAPITNIAPLLAFAKVGSIRLANKYYRFL